MIDFKNAKQIGEIGERIAIGELSKFGIDILLPMSDNLSFDFVIFYKNKMYKCQVKSTAVQTVNGAWDFSLTSNNWNTGSKTIYKDGDYDILILCNMQDVFILPFDEIKGRKNFAIRCEPPANNQIKGINFARDYIISQDRIDKILG